MRGRRAPAAIALVFAVLGILLLIFGDAEARVIGLMSVLFFGVGGSVFLVPVLSRRGNGTLRLADAGLERGVLVPISRAKQVLVAVAAVGMGAASALIALANPWIGVPGAAVFGLFGTLALVRLRGESGLLLTPTRVIAAYGNRSEIAWDDVAQVFLFEQSRARMLGLTAVSPERVQRARNGPLARFNRSLTPADIVLPADYFTVAPERVVEILIAYREQPARRVALGTEAELARVL